MESSELRRIALKRGEAIVHIAVTKPVVINTTSTQPGTSPLSDSLEDSVARPGKEGTIDSVKDVNICERVIVVFVRNACIFATNDVGLVEEWIFFMGAFLRSIGVV